MGYLLFGLGIITLFVQITARVIVLADYGVNESGSLMQSTIGDVISLMALMFWVWARYLRMGTWAPAGIHPDEVREHRLCEFGPYRVVRHPMYLAYIITASGVEIAWHSWLVLVVPTLFFFGLALLAKKEEIDLVDVYREKYEDYKKRVPSRLIPLLF
jgi:protein-S-isoprenylcysteine O-methyltransferase Ste14